MMHTSGLLDHGGGEGLGEVVGGADPPLRVVVVGAAQEVAVRGQRGEAARIVLLTEQPWHLVECPVGTLSPGARDDVGVVVEQFQQRGAIGRAGCAPPVLRADASVRRIGRTLGQAAQRHVEASGGTQHGALCR
ncbi:hypothetical protein [Propionibacterium freudenreichii]|uniref:hypothetical protein n=1 Tax=Propionibacterium freudenreichii TaxID=1744 RepID=UPI00254F539C|nr:hypothetical protein [Propionibacterium freudenreichii]